MGKVVGINERNVAILDDRKTFKILAIDGGGIKGLYSSTILEHLEEKYNCSISDYFDMICGTSTGGLIALALSLKVPAKKISEFYMKKGGAIFPCRPVRNFLGQILWGGKFSDKALRSALEEMFQEHKIEDSNNLLCIPSYSITDARPWVFKYDHKEGQLDRDNKVKYVDVALATSAAPTYLPLCEIEVYDKKQFIDGGVWANNPTLVGLIEALHYFVGKQKEFKDIQILSLSSLTLSGGKPIGLNRHRSFVKWRSDLFDTFNIGQSLFSDYFMRCATKFNDVKIEYHRVPSEMISSDQERLVQMDKATPQALSFIRGKGNDRGEHCKKDENIAKFFSIPKTYKTK